ncbi:MAG: type II toxin-antitoxin system Phd/YefM family antitoxin [Cyanobacteria bacterium P01_A01_bin.83]
MLDLSRAHPLDEFQQEAPALLDQFKTDKTPIVLTVDGQAAAVLQDAESYQQLLDKIELLETLAGIRNSLEEFEQGKGIPLKQAFKQLQEKHYLPD